MKKRIISALVALAIFIPIIVKGGVIFDIAFFLLAMQGLKELMDVTEKKKKIPVFIKLICYLILTGIFFIGVVDNKMILNIDFRIIAGTFLILLLPTVLYHNKKVYNVKDSFYLLGGLLFLGTSMSIFVMYRNIGLELFIFLFLITIITDTFAYTTGRLIGKNKLLEEISPNKTWEGLFGGSIMGTFICTVYYTTIIDPNVSLSIIVPVILFLTVVGQFGDLFFSSIKRYYGVKDFSNIMPGHGGVLDRFDSVIFVMLAFTFFLTII